MHCSTPPAIRRNSHAQYRSCLFAVERPRRCGRAGRMAGLQGPAPRPCAQSAPVLAVAGRRAAVCAAVGHPAEAAPPGERPAGRCRRHRAGAGRAAAAVPCPRRSRSCGPAALVRPADAVARAGGGLAGRCAGAGCARGHRLPEIKALCGAGLQNARRLLRRGVRARAVHTGLCAPAHLPAGQLTRPGAAGCAAA